MIRYILMLSLVAVGACATPLRAQVPDRRGEVRLDRPEYKGVRANTPIPPHNHVYNRGGSDGAGICVVCALTISGGYQGVGDLHKGEDSKLYRTARSRPGGHNPAKLKALLDEVMPGEDWVSILTTDANMIRKYSAMGYPVANTMNTGAQYRYMPINHFVTTIHADENMSCFVDNNDPGHYRWIPAAEQDRRFVDGGTGWLFVWLKKRTSRAGWIIAAAILIGGAALCLGKQPSP